MRLIYQISFFCNVWANDFERGKENISSLQCTIWVRVFSLPYKCLLPPSPPECPPLPTPKHRNINQVWLVSYSYQTGHSALEVSGQVDGSALAGWAQKNRKQKMTLPKCSFEEWYKLYCLVIFWRRKIFSSKRKKNNQH